MVNIVTKTVSNFVEWVGCQGEVLDVQPWNPDSLYRIDLHLPSTHMAKWTTIHRMKCRVGLFDFRDYSPTQWNATKRTCSLYVEVGHEGPGSEWVRQLRPHTPITYTVSPTQAVPTRPGKILCLGDGSALGHFLALKQLTGSNQFPMEAAVFLHENYELPPALLINNPEFDFLIKTGKNAEAALRQWLVRKSIGEFSFIYLNGFIPMVQNLRRELKAMPDMQAKLFVQGFWK